MIYTPNIKHYHKYQRKNNSPTRNVHNGFFENMLQQKGFLA